MVRECIALGTLARKPAHGRPGDRLLRRKFIFRGAGLELFDSGVLTAPCGGADNSSDVDRFIEIGLHIWSTIYLIIHARVAVLKSGLVLAVGVAGPRSRRAESSRRSYRAGAIVSEVARRYEISPQHLFAWRKTARAGLLTLPNEGELTFVPIVTPGDNSATVGDPRESRLIRIEIAGAVVHAEPGVDLVFLTAAATIIAGTKPAACASGPVGSRRNARRHVTSNERDMPWRLAVEDIARGVCRLSMTIRSFSSSDQRRRRPVSTTSSRSISVLCLWLSIRTVTHHLT